MEQLDEVGAGPVLVIEVLRKQYTVLLAWRFRDDKRDGASGAAGDAGGAYPRIPRAPSGAGLALAAVALALALALAFALALALAALIRAVATVVASRANVATSVWAWVGAAVAGVVECEADLSRFVGPRFLGG